MTQQILPDKTLRIETDSEIYVLKTDGRLFLSSKKERKSVLLCEGLTVLGLIRDENGTAWSLGIRVKDLDGKPHLLRLKNSELASRMRLYWSEVSDVFYTNPYFSEAAWYIQNFLKACRPTERLCLQTKTGWSANQKAFLLPPDRVFTSKNVPHRETVYAEIDTTISEVFQPSGNCDLWIHNVSRIAGYSSRLTLAICVALSSPLLPCSNVHENGGIHFWGKTSIGKSLTLSVAASVFMDPENAYASWNTTPTGLEALAVARNHGLMVMDELGALRDQDIIGQIIYQIANGTGKIRGTKAAKLAQTNRWRCCFLSSGEITLSDILKRYPGLSFPGGIGVRFHEVPLACNENNSLFEHLPTDIASVEAAIETISAGFNENFGVLGPAWIQVLVDIGFDELKNQIHESWQQNRDAFSIADMPSAQRAGKRFHLFGFAGDLATKNGLTSWAEGHAMATAKQCFQEWTEIYFRDFTESIGTVKTLATDLLNRTVLVPLGQNLNKEHVGWDNSSYCALMEDAVLRVYGLSPATWVDVKGKLAKEGCFIKQGRHLSRPMTKSIAGNNYDKYQKATVYFLDYAALDAYLKKR